MGERARWRKVWSDVWSSLSHVELDATALYVFVVLVVHASWEPGQDEARLLAGDGTPLSQGSLARLARLTAARFRRALAALVGVGSVRLDGDVIVLPNYGRWQESSSAHRMRRKRGSKRHSDAHSAANIGAEGEGEGEGDGSPPLPPRGGSDTPRVANPAEPRETPRATPAAATWLDPHAVELARLREWRTYGGDPDGLGPWPTPSPPTGPTLPQLTLHAKLAERLAEGRTALDVHRLAHTLGAMVESGALQPSEHRAVYVFSGHFEALEQRAAEWRDRASTTPQHADTTALGDELLAAIGGDA